MINATYLLKKYFPALIFAIIGGFMGLLIGPFVTVLLFLSLHYLWGAVGGVFLGCAFGLYVGSNDHWGLEKRLQRTKAARSA